MATTGYSARCRACNSQHRAGIDERLLAGESARAVASWLLDTQGERIPFQALANHKAEHLQVLPVAAAIVERAEPVFAAAVAKVVADAAVLNEVATIALDTARALSPAIASGKAPMAVAVAFNGALSNARSAVTDRHELLHGKKLNVNTDNGDAPDAESLHARLAALADRAADRADPGATRTTDPGGAG